MSANNSGSANTPQEPTTNNNDDTVSLDQIISVDQNTISQASMHLNTSNMIPSQVPTVAEVLRAQFLRRRREARRRQHQRRAQRRRQQIAATRRQQRTVTRRQRRAQRYRQILIQSDIRWYEEHREREHRREEEREHEEYLRSRSPTFDELVEETIQEQLLDVYEWEKMTPKDRWEQEQIQEMEGIAALEQIALVQDEMEQLQQIDELERSEVEELRQRKHREEQRNQEQLHQLESNSTQRSHNSTLDPIEMMQQIDLMDRSQEAQHQQKEEHEQMQLQDWETNASQHYHYDQNPCPGLFREMKNNKPN